MFDLFNPHTIWGERVGLRPATTTLTDGEVEQVYRWSNDKEVLQWSGGEPTDLSLDEFRKKLAGNRWRPQSSRRIFYILIPEGNVIGRIGLFTIDWAMREGELGILIDRDYWGRRYGREAVMLLLHYVFSELHLDRVFLSTASENIRAQKSFAACGFRVTGPGRRYVHAMNSFIEDGIGMEITKQEFMGGLE